MCQSQPIHFKKSYLNPWIQVYDDVKNVKFYSDIEKAYDDIGKDDPRYATVINRSSSDLTRVFAKNNQLLASTEDLADGELYDDVDNVNNSMNGIEEDPDYDNSNEEAFHQDLVTARPAVIVEDGLDSLSAIYDDIHRDDNGDHMTLYESIAGSLMRLDKIEVYINIFYFYQLLQIFSCFV